jgi:zinc transporter 1/2/3
VKSIVLEVSIAIHSIIIGISFGGLTVDYLIEIKVLMAAFAFHQFFEGISLGTAISESNLKFRTVCIFGVFFALTWCIGAIIGINLASEEEVAQDDGYVSQGAVIQSCFEAVAAGSLIYSSLVEMIAEDFSSSELINKPILKFSMLLFLSLGCVAMAVLALYV